MPIESVVGFKSVQWFRRGGKYVIASPVRKDFKWDNPVVWADCDTCPKDEFGHVLIDEFCHCGIYVALTLSVVRSYNTKPGSVLLLVEARGKDNIWLADDEENRNWYAGFTAPGVQAVYIVNDELLAPMNGSRILSERALASMALSQRWHMNILSLDDALGIAQIMWEKEGMIWGKRTPDDQIRRANK